MAEVQVEEHHVPADIVEATAAWEAGEVWAKALKVGDIFPGAMHPAKEYAGCTDSLKYKCFLSGAIRSLPQIWCAWETGIITKLEPKL